MTQQSNKIQFLQKYKFKKIKKNNLRKKLNLCYVLPRCPKGLKKKTASRNWGYDVRESPIYPTDRHSSSTKLHLLPHWSIRFSSMDTCNVSSFPATIIPWRSKACFRSSPKHFMRSDDSAVAPAAGHGHGHGHGFQAPSAFALLLNAPQPPSLWKELSGSLRSALLPEGKTPASFRKWILSVLHGLFPVLDWGRSYDLSSFKSDLMAGLTLASLGIPQVIYYLKITN